MISLFLIYRPSSMCTFMSVYQSTSRAELLLFLSLEHMVLSENLVRERKEKVVLKDNLR